MNSHYVIFNRDTGEIVKSVFCQTSVLDLYTNDGELGHIEVDAMQSPENFMVVDGVVVEKTEKPLIPYGQQRMYAYPSVNDQLDCLWHAMDQGLLPKIEPMYSQVKAVKESIPKVK